MITTRRRLIAQLAMLALFLSCACLPSHGFAAAKSTSLVEMRRRSLSKAKTGTARAKKNAKHQRQQTPPPCQWSKSYVVGVLDEALFRQQLAIDALGREVGRRSEEKTDDAPKISRHEAQVVESSARCERKIGRDILCRVETRKEELRVIHSRLHKLLVTIESKTKSRLLAPEELELFAEQILQLGYGSILNQPESAWKSTKARRQFGRPHGFDGEMFHSPLGTPILVGRMNAHKDETMRNAAQGADLWFQVEDYEGARVLLRTSLMRGTAGSKVCKKMAANLAAKYSVWGDDYECVPVMYTDSRKVAKKGSRAGNMKRSKSLGRIMGYPNDII